MFLCTYTALHLHVPGVWSSFGFKPREYSGTRLMLKKVKFMALSIIFPETMITAGKFVSEFSILCLSPDLQMSGCFFRFKKSCCKYT
jgi:hypothetical protein